MSIYTNPEIIPEIIKVEKSKNFFKQIVFHPCARPWYIYVETFILAFVTLFFNIVLLDEGDAIREYGEIISRTRRTGVRRHGRPGARPVFTSSETKTDRWSRRGLGTVLRITSPLETVSFIFLLVILVDRFFSDWQGLLEASPFCVKNPSTGPFSRTDPDPVLTISATGQAFGYDTLEQNRGGWFNTPLTVAPSTGKIFGFATLAATANQGGLSNAALRVKVVIDGDTKVFTGDFISAEKDEQVEWVVDFRVFARFLSTPQISWEMVGDPQLGALTTASGSVFVMIETPS